MSSFDIYPVYRKDTNLDKAHIFRSNDDDAELCKNHRQILKYFDSKTNGARHPRREDLNPAELKIFLPEIMLLDVEYPAGREDGPPDFKTRVMGEKVKEFYGDLTGKGPDDIPLAETRDRFFKVTQQVFEHLQPVIGRATNTSPSGRPATVDMLFVPMMDIEDRIDKLLIHANIQLG